MSRLSPRTNREDRMDLHRTKVLAAYGDGLHGVQEAAGGLVDWSAAVKPARVVYGG